MLFPLEEGGDIARHGRGAGSEEQEEGAGGQAGEHGYMPNQLFARTLAKQTWRSKGGQRKQAKVGRGRRQRAAFGHGGKVPQNITTSVKSMVEAAEREIEEIAAADAVKLHGRDDVVLVDLRDPRELRARRQGAGRVPLPRGMLEFWIDPESPYYKPKFAEDKKFVFFCAGGLRSALAAQTAQHMGLKPVAHILGGLPRLEEGRRAGGAGRGAEEERREEIEGPRIFVPRARPRKLVFSLIAATLAVCGRVYYILTTIAATAHGDRPRVLLLGICPEPWRERRAVYRQVSCQRLH